MSFNYQNLIKNIKRLNSSYIIIQNFIGYQISGGNDATGEYQWIRGGDKRNEMIANFNLSVQNITVY